MVDASITIRQARLSDARAIAKVHVEAWRHAYSGLVPDSYIARLSIDKREVAWQKSLAEGMPEVWVADSPQGILGWVAFGWSRDDDATTGVGEIEAIYIEPEYWRRGIGQALWLQARQRLVDRNFVSVTLWVLADNSRAIRFYESQGFSASAEAAKISERDGKKLKELRYEAELCSVATASLDSKLERAAITPLP